MIEPTQILLFIVVVILTILLVVIGWQIYRILSELYKMLTKINSMVDGAVSLSGNIKKSFRDLSGFSEGLRSVLSFLRIFKKEERSERK